MQIFWQGKTKSNGRKQSKNRNWYSPTFFEMTLAVMPSPTDPRLRFDPAADNLAPGTFSNMQISPLSDLISFVNDFTLVLDPNSFQICNPTMGGIYEAFQYSNIALDIQDEHVKIGFRFDGVFTLGDHGRDDDWKEGPILPTLEISTEPLASTSVTLTVGNTMYVSYVCVQLDVDEDDD